MSPTTCPPTAHRPRLASAFVSVSIALGIALAVTAADQAAHSRPAKSRDKLARTLAQTQKRSPEVVLLGNSLLGKGVDAPTLESLTGLRVEKLAFHGHGSAMWYLVSRNLVARLDPSPRLVAVLFQDFILTQPGLNVTGGYRRQIEEWRRPEGEPTLDRLAYRAQMTWLETEVLRRWRLFDESDHIKGKAEGLVKRVGEAVAGAARHGDADDAIDRVFATEKMNRDLLTVRQQLDERGKEVERGPFADEVRRSFLPAMVDMARERGYSLVFVRMKRRPGVVVAPVKQAEKERYAADLRAWLDARGSALIDFTGDDRLTLDHYADGDHLNDTLGQPLFTRMLADALAPYLAANGAAAPTTPPASEGSARP